MDEETIKKVWEKARPIPDHDFNQIRQDRCGSEIARHEYGNRNSSRGWEIDHKNPRSGDEISNLDPLQWKNNVKKSDGSLNCDCSRRTVDHT